ASTTSLTWAPISCVFAGASRDDCTPQKILLLGGTCQPRAAFREPPRILALLCLAPRPGCVSIGVGFSHRVRSSGGLSLGCRDSARWVIPPSPRPNNSRPFFHRDGDRLPPVAQARNSFFRPERQCLRLCG